MLLSGALPAAEGTALAFGQFHLDLRRKVLYRDGELLTLGTRALEILCALATTPGDLLTKDDLMRRVWPGVAVEDNNLSVQISVLRKALGSNVHGQSYIMTVPGRGYRFLPDAVQRASGAPAPAPRAAEKPSIAVLPFTNMSPDASQEHFADGLVEDVITALSRLRWLFVIARNSTYTYKGRAVDIRCVGRELGVRYVLEGSFRAVGERIRVTAQLIEARTGAHIWADRYDRELGDIFAVQDEITTHIVAALEPNLHCIETARAKAKPIGSLDAYDLFRRALPELYAPTEESCARAERLLRQAITIDPDYSNALAALTECITRRWLNGWISLPDIPRAQTESLTMARRAIAADPQNGAAIATAAYAFACHMRRFEEGLDFAERALQIHPNSAQVRSLCGGAFVHCGEVDRAIQQYEVALRLNPLDPRRYLMFNGVAMAHFFGRRFEEAEQWSRRSLIENSAWAGTRRYHAASLVELGRLSEAQAEIHELLKMQPNASITRSRLNSFRYDWMYELYLNALRLAGLPESSSRS